jgi:hypothetical protein
MCPPRQNTSSNQHCHECSFLCLIPCPVAPTLQPATLFYFSWG